MLSVKFIGRKDLKPGLYRDSPNLYLQVSQRGKKAWICRFMILGRARKMGLGSVDLVKLADARRMAYEARLKVLEGVDPIEARNERRASQAAQNVKATTFEQCARDYIEAHRHAWKNQKHVKQWPASLESYVFPVIGKLPVAMIDKAHVMKILQPIWLEKTVTADRIRGRIERILDRAKVLGLRDGENPARWGGFLDQLLPAKAQVAVVAHHAAMPYAELPGFMRRLRARDSLSARALEWTILSACRTNDAVGSRWSEIDLDKKTWTVPGSRLKSRKGAGRPDHAVPLTERMIALLPPRTGERIFPVGTDAMADCLQSLGSDTTVHGFRSTFRDWTFEMTSHPHEVCELALAHTVGTKVERAYRRGDGFERRRQLMEDWSAYCDGPRANVVAMVRK
jgi:integrase